jgi:sugar transferase (PEP-CTERM/EpsH1 system associated)
MRWVHAREGRMLGQYEAAVAQRADANLFVSDAEAALFRTRTPSAQHVMTLENGIALDHFALDADWLALPEDQRPAGPMAVFTGQMDYRPNIAAVRDFAEQVLPLLRQVHPTACFAIVGRAPTAEVRALADRPGVIVTGEVPDTRPWLAAASAVVAPLQVARGVQNKLLEAMAMARPVVASTAAAQGIDAVVGRDLLVADTPQAMADAVSALFADGARAAEMGAAARRRMQQRYSWETAMAPLRSCIGLGGA